MDNKLKKNPPHKGGFFITHFILIKMKVFCIGTWKTGTTSIGRGLEYLLPGKHKSWGFRNLYLKGDYNRLLRISEGFNSKKIKIVDRPKGLSLSSTSTDDLIRYVPEIMLDGHILWTHVTSPFIGSEIYEKIIETYFKSLGQHDSLMTVTKLQKFMWYNGAPVNYDRKIEKWPRTQTIEPLWEVNSGAFLATREIYKNRLDRIGEKPFLYPLSDYIAFDIDWVQDFKLAEDLFKKI